MKTQFINRLICLFFLMTGWASVQGQNQIEVPGDNFSLEGALELFKKSASPEEFERKLNDPDSRVNNLDLNGDGYIDYMRVYDINEGNVHAFVIQAVISDRESQDVAVITLEKLANGKAVLQITGDEDIYGIETIIEPTQEVRTYGGTTSSRVVVNVWAWPSVQYIYGPYYSAWASPWGWGYRPYWYHAWRPVVYYDYYSYWRPYHHYYSPCYTHRVVFAHRIYRSQRTTSVIVHHRHNHQITQYRSTRIDNNGNYRANSDRSSSRQVGTSARYNANGRLSSSSNQAVSGRSSSSRVTQQRGTYNRNSGDTPVSSRSYNGSSTNQRTVQRSQEGSSGRSSSNSSVQGSTNSNVQRSGGNSNSSQSSDNSGIQRSTSRSSGSSNVQRSSGSSNNRQSSGNSSIQRSSGRSSGSSNVQRSNGSSSSRQSSGSSNVQRSSGRSSSANVQRSSGSSGSSRSSGSSGSRQSSGSSSKGRGRH